MGYIRMMRSGGIHCCSNASVFLDIADEKLKFVECCEINRLITTTKKSATNLEYEISHLHHNNAEATEYFRVG